MFINQCLILVSVNVNPAHSLALVAVITYPLMTMLKAKDLKKVDPYNQLIQLKGEFEEAEILPTGGLSTRSQKWELR